MPNYRAFGSAGIRLACRAVGDPIVSCSPLISPAQYGMNSAGESNRWRSSAYFSSKSRSVMASRSAQFWSLQSGSPRELNARIAGESFTIGTTPRYIASQVRCASRPLPGGESTNLYVTRVCRYSGWSRRLGRPSATGRPLGVFERLRPLDGMRHAETEEDSVLSWAR